MHVLDWLAGLPPAVWIQESGTAYLLVNAAHILGISLLLGGIIVLDLRLIGIVGSFPIAAVGPVLLRASATGLGLAFLAGFWLFLVKPREYLSNPAFLAKLGLLGAAICNIGLQHCGPRFRAALQGESVHVKVRFHAAVSLIIWLAVLLAGRWIGFV